MINKSDSYYAVMNGNEHKIVVYLYIETRPSLHNSQTTLRSNYQTIGTVAEER